MWNKINNSLSYIKLAMKLVATSDIVNKIFIQSTIIITESSWILQKHVLYAEVILM